MSQIQQENNDKDNKMNFIQRITGIFISPLKVMENINDKPIFLEPILANAVVALILSVLSTKYMSIYSNYLLDFISQRYGMEFYNYYKSLMSTSSASITPATLIIGIISSIIGIIFSAVISALLLFVFIRIFGGKAKYKSLFSAFLYVSIVTGVFGILGMTLQVITNTATDVFSLAILIPDGNMANPIFNLLSTMSISNILTALFVGIIVRGMTSLSNYRIIIMSTIVLILLIFIGTVSQSAMVSYYDFMANTVKGMM